MPANPQSIVGNMAMQRQMRAAGVQAKVEVGPENDSYEREADAAAEHRWGHRRIIDSGRFLEFLR